LRTNASLLGYRIQDIYYKKRIEELSRKDRGITYVGKEDFIEDRRIYLSGQSKSILYLF
jgi:hypothetical protein